MKACWITLVFVSSLLLVSRLPLIIQTPLNTIICVVYAFWFIGILE